MAFEMKENTGSLFKNDRREKDTHANAKGTALIGGVEYWVDAWTNEAKDGSKYQSLKFRPKEARPQAAPEYPNYSNTRPPIDLDDETPF